MKIFAVLVSLIVIVIGSFYFFSRFRSAFEADQQCHYEISLKQSDFEGLGCDHDLETRQWILYEQSKSNLPSKVLKRFKY